MQNDDKIFYNILEIIIMLLYNIDIYRFEIILNALNKRSKYKVSFRERIAAEIFLDNLC